MNANRQRGRTFTATQVLPLWRLLLCVDALRHEALLPRQVAAAVDQGRVGLGCECVFSFVRHMTDMGQLKNSISSEH